MHYFLIIRNAVILPQTCKAQVAVLYAKKVAKNGKMDVFQIIGIALSVYFFAPFLVLTCEYLVHMRNKAIKLETFPVANTLTHIVFSVFLTVGVFLNAMWAYIVSGVIYVIKLFTMCFLTKEMSYASNSRNESSTQQFLQNLRRTKPYLEIFVRCWHKEVYYTTETHTDSNGHRHTHYERHERDVTTYTETRYVQVTGWFDQTPSLALPELYRQRSVISLHLHTAVDYYKNSGEIVRLMLADAYNQNRYRDQCCATTLSKQIPGLTEFNYLCYKLPLYMYKWFVMLSLLFAFDCPLLLHVRAVTPHCQLVVKKVVSLLPNYKSTKSEVATPDSATEITPPTYVTTIDYITPPVEMMVNMAPLFTDNITAPQDFDRYAFAPIEPPYNTPEYVSPGHVAL